MSPLFEHLQLLSLPGTELNALRESLSLQGFQIATSQTSSRTLLVIDVRGAWSERLSGTDIERYLDDALRHCDAVVFMQLAAADLALQMSWQAWLNQRLQHLSCDKRPVLRALQTDLNTASLDTLRQLPSLSKYTVNESIWLNHQVLKFPVQKLQLAHFMMGLDGLVHNGMGQIWHISGSFWTLEYAHPVALNLSPLRVEMAPVEQAAGHIICVVSAQEADVLSPFIEQIIQACQCS